MLSSTNLGIHNAKNIVNSAYFFKEMEKNKLKQSVEANKGAKLEENHRDLL